MTYEGIPYNINELLEKTNDQLPAKGKLIVKPVLPFVGSISSIWIKADLDTNHSKCNFKHCITFSDQRFVFVVVLAR